jgi:hypothetical protein
VTAASIISIISALLGLAKWFVAYAEQKRWMDAGAAQAALKGIADADIAIKDANDARQIVRDQHARDPSSVRDDDGFKRSDD